MLNTRGGGKEFLQILNPLKSMKPYLLAAKRHIEARKSGTFDLQTVKNLDEAKAALTSGKTIASLLDHIEITYTSITSIILSHSLFHESRNYKAGVNKGFKILFDKLNIQTYGE